MTHYNLWEYTKGDLSVFNLIDDFDLLLKITKRIIDLSFYQWGRTSARQLNASFLIMLLVNTGYEVSDDVKKEMLEQSLGYRYSSIESSTIAAYIHKVYLAFLLDQLSMSYDYLDMDSLNTDTFGIK